jgi:hypothetical protein
MVREISTSGDIASAMHNQVSTLSLGKANDLTIRSMAWLRLPLAIAASAFSLGATAAMVKQSRFAVAGFAVMMLILFSAARLAMITLNPYFSSHVLAEALIAAPPGQLIVDDQYYSFSSVFFYTNRRALLLNGRKMNLEYGSYAPNAPSVFLTDDDFSAHWLGNKRCYLTTTESELPRIRNLVGRERLHQLQASGGKRLFTNQPLPYSQLLGELE